MNIWRLMLKNPKAKGSRIERLAMDHLIKDGCVFVIKSGGSLGMFDIIGFRTSQSSPCQITGIRLVQCKANRITKKERVGLQAFMAAEIWIKPDYHHFKKYRWDGSHWNLLM